MDAERYVSDRHLFIAGTGRAGTSFLVRYLTELGIDTHLKRHGLASGWDENANAGLEDAAFLSSSIDLPYVIKSPFLYAYIDELIDRGTFKADAVIIPVRDLAEAAISRSVLERRAIHQTAAWMSELDSTWEHWGHVPGGIIYSLNPIDQGRLLAVGFHHLIQRLVVADIPIIFLAFPRFVEDGTYLFDKLHPLLPHTIDKKAACAVHRRVADQAKVRIGAELSAQRLTQPHTAKIMDYASHTALDGIALQREIKRLRHEAARLAEQLRLQCTAATEERDHQIRVLEAALAEAIAGQDQACLDRDAALAETVASREQVRRLHQEMAEKVAQLQAQSALDRQRRAELEDALAQIHASRSWRITGLYRAIGSFARRIQSKAV
jgi:hypothetical protein